MKEDFSKFLEKFTGKGKIYYYVLIGLLGIMMLVSGEGNDFTKEKELKNDDFLQEYKLKIEKELTDFLGTVEGVGEVKVVVSFNSGQENIYAQKEKSVDNVKKEYGDDYVNNSTYENEYIIIKNTGEEHALIEKIIQPEVRGVAVSCSGADDISVVWAVTNTVSVVLDVPTHKICVTKMR